LSAPYYAGAIIVFLFVLGCLVAPRRYVWWLVTVSIIGVMLSWGSNFEAFNYFLFDHLPGYNKFRSVTFSMVMVFFAMPLLGLLALEKLLDEGIAPQRKKQLWIAFSATAGVCLFMVLFTGLPGYTREVERELPQWFLNALRADRESMLRSDAFRSFAFIAVVFVVLYFNLHRKISLWGFFALLIFLVAIDVSLVDKRYFTAENYQRKRDNTRFEPTAADNAILQDKEYYRVFNLQEFYEARTANFHQSLGGYSGVRLKRYQELYDSCISREHEQLIRDAQQGSLNFSEYGVLNMLNTRYFVYGPERDNVIPNPTANGVGWFVQSVLAVQSANEELAAVKTADTKTTAVMDLSKFKLSATQFEYDSVATITLLERKPYQLRYETNSLNGGLAVFSEIYYPKGWTATIDGKEASILRANYVLRALEVPAGKHTIEFQFRPKPYIIGNKVTMASSWLLLLVVVGSLGWSLVKNEN